MPFYISVLMILAWAMEQIYRWVLFTVVGAIVVTVVMGHYSSDSGHVESKRIPPGVME